MWEMRALAFDTGGRAFIPQMNPELHAPFESIGKI
jgi:hypothetical protein